MKKDDAQKITDRQRHPMTTDEIAESVTGIETDLTNADLFRADLTGADLTNAILTDTIS